MKIANYMTTGLRHLLNHKLFSAINIFGLAIGLMACILITLFVQDELSYDEDWKDSNRIYRMHTELRIPGQAPFFLPQTPGPVKHALPKDYSGVETTARARMFSPILKIGEDVYLDTVKWVDPEFVDIFNFDIIAGDMTSTMKDASSLAISRERAIKYFGSVDKALGGVISVNRGPIQRDFKVGTIFEDLPQNTHLSVEAMAPVDEADFVTEPWNFSSWWGTNVFLYIKMKDGADIKPLQDDLSNFADRNYPTEHGTKGSDIAVHSIIPVGDIQLKSIGAYEMKPVGNINTVITYSAVAILILIIASINFTNLSTARATQRAREVAVRKVLGANKTQLILQFLGESILVTMIALIIALASVELLLPAYNEALNKELTVDYGLDGLLPIYTLLAFLVGIGGGIYPALILSGFRPSSVLKANKSAETSGTMKLRMILVVFQFAVSIGLMVSTAVVYGQSIYAKSLNQGFNKENLLQLDSFSRPGAEEKQKVILDELRRHPQVISISRSSSVPGSTDSNNTNLHIPGSNSADDPMLGTRDVDFNFFETYQTKMLAGRSYDIERGDRKPTKEDVLAGRTKGSLIINYTALARLGFATPEDAVGQILQYGRGAHEGKPVWADMEIIGVSEDFNIESVHREVRPEVYFLDPNDQYRTMSARFVGDPATLVADVEKLLKSTIPDVPINITFANEALAKQYADEDAQSTLFAIFSLLAIVVACLGLFGLASFTAERRTKEIGLRKVMGASIFDIVKLLLWQFSFPVLIANIIAWPAAWYFMNDWLSQFVYRFDSIYIAGFCLIAGSLAMLIAWITISANAIKVAKSNPINALRYE